MKKILKLTESDITRIVKRVIKESCENGKCIPDFFDPSYFEFIRRGKDMDSELFDELFDEMSGKSYFSFERSGEWYDEDDEWQNKNQVTIIKTFPTIDTISSWKDWVNSDWFKTTHFCFSKTATKEPINIKVGGGNFKIGEEPIQNKKRYFEDGLKHFGPLLVKKKK